MQLPEEKAMKQRICLSCATIWQVPQYIIYWVVAAVVLLAVGSCKPQQPSQPLEVFQTGIHVGDDIVVSLDNPDFTEQSVMLTPANTLWNGVLARSIDVTSQGFSVGNGDFHVETWNGDGPAKTNGVSTFASVSNEE